MDSGSAVSLRELLDRNELVRLIEAHDIPSALIAQYSSVPSPHRGPVQFDGIWSSSLVDAACRGLPDIELLGVHSRLQRITEILAVVQKPLLMDADTGGAVEHFEYSIASLERAGVSGVVIEDKCGLKQNSLLSNPSDRQELAVIDEFCEKISRGKKAQSGSDFMIIARLESLILNRGQSDALDRAAAYIDAGADGIVIHSRSRSPVEVLDFAESFRKSFPTVPLGAIPTSYNGISSRELGDAGFNVVIFANHLMRAAFRAMDEAAKMILEHDRGLEVESNCADVNTLIDIDLYRFRGGS